MEVSSTKLVAILSRGDELSHILYCCACKLDIVHPNWILHLSPILLLNCGTRTASKSMYVGKVL